MNTSSAHRLNSSGQTLLLAICIGTLAVIGVVAISFMHQQSTLQGVGSSQRQRNRDAALSGVYYGIQELSASLNTWNRALAGDFTNSDCNTGTFIKSVSGDQFTLRCSVGQTNNPGLQPYQVAITATAAPPNGSRSANSPLRAVTAYVSQRTVGVDAAGLHAAAAVEFVRSPLLWAGPVNIWARLNVQWGPIVDLDTEVLQPFRLIDPIDTGRYPRKFGQGGIYGGMNSAVVRTGPNPPPDTGAWSDRKEYWAYTPMLPPPLIDEQSYIEMAKNTPNVITNLPTDYMNNNAPVSPTCAPFVTNCGYFDTTNLPPGDVLEFDDAAGYSLGRASGTIYVNGNARFKRTAFKNTNFIVTGYLSVMDDSTGNALDLHVPASAPNEYPYMNDPNNPAPDAWPCNSPSKIGALTSSGQADYSKCNSNADAVFGTPGNLVQFQGFLWVKGDMIVGRFDADMNWNMVGTLVVGDVSAPADTTGQLFVGNWGQHLTNMAIAYDDIVNHNILVLPVERPSVIRVEPDSIKDTAIF